MFTLPPDSDEELEKPFSFVPGVRFKKPFGPDIAPVYEEEAEWGMGRRQLNPATFGFFPWTSLTVDDEYVVVVNGEEIKSGFVTDTTAVAYYVTVPQMPPGLVEIRGLVIRAHSTHRSYSPPTKVLIIPTHPAGFDQDTNKPWHSGLKMTIEGMPKGSPINTDIGETGFLCLINKHLYARKNDVLIVRCGGIDTRYTLSEQEAKGPGPFKVWITPEVIDQLDKSGEIEVVYTVENVVKTRPGGDYQFSESYRLVSELDSKLRPNPYFIKDDSESNDLDLSADSQATLKMEVTPLLTRPIPKPLNQITGIVTLKYADGKTETVRLPSVQDSGRGTTLNIPLDYALFKDLENGAFRLSYELHTAAGTPLATSSSKLVNVKGLPVSLPPVTVEGLLAGLLANDKDAVATIPKYRPYSSTWRETFCVVAKDGSAMHSDPQVAGAEGGTRRVTKETLKKFEGRRVELFYTIDKRDGTSVTTLTSAKVEAVVGTWVGELPAPVVEVAKDGYIDPEEVLDEEFVVKFPYDGTLNGDVVAHSLTGRSSTGSASGTFNITEDTEGQPFAYLLFPLERRLLDNNKDFEISLRYTVSRPSTKQVLRSEVAYLTVGKKPVLKQAEVIEAGAMQYEILPKNLTLGASVVASFTQARSTDLVTVYWQGAFNLSSAEVLAIWDSKTHSFVARIEPEVIARGVRKGGNKITVWYEFIRGRTTHKSEPKEFLLKPLQYRPAPTIVDVGAGATALRLYQLTDNAIIRIAPWNLINAGHLVKTQLSGVFVDGTPYQEIFNDGKVTTDHITNGFSLPAPVESLRQLQDNSRLSIKCWVDLTGTGDETVSLLFEENTYVIEAIASNQPAPAFGNIAGSKITVYAPDHAKKAFLTVAFAGMRTAQKITAQIIFPDGTLAAIAPQNGVSTGRIDFPINDELLAKMVNKDMTMRYTVLTSGAAMITSQAQEVSVQPLREADLPQVLINGIPNNGTLDLNNKDTPNVLAALAPWPLIGKGQQVKITIEAKGIPTLTVRESLPIDAAQAISGLKDIEVMRSWLDTVPPNTPIIVNGSVILDASNDPDRVTILRPTTYTVNAKLKLNASVINLNGISVRVNWPRTGVESIGNTAQLVTTGGSGAVTWSSNSPGVVSVTPHGFIKANSWGTVTITAKDQAGNVATCQVNASNVYNLAFNNSLALLAPMVAWINTGHRAVGFDGIGDLQRVYGAALPVDYFYWLGYADPGRGYFYHFQNRGIFLGGENNHNFRGMTLVRA
ncbi:hypothetical protein [Pseudomonas sp. L1(2025)]|uniref:hypothetical protein n=1 Tax=Pseudomonas sp. L1(2025) TaxID=3449429 RepID=UPI003F68DEF1